MREAARNFDIAQERDPENFWARYFLALSYLRLQPPRPDLAKAPLTACINQRRDFIWPYLVRGFAHTKLKDFPAAKADFEQALQLQPSKNALHVLYANRGVLWFEQQKFDEAVAAFTEALKTERPGSAEYEESVRLLGQSLYLKSKYKEAIPWL